jgi:hypothetical protein
MIEIDQINSSVIVAFVTNALTQQVWLWIRKFLFCSYFAGAQQVEMCARMSRFNCTDASLIIFFFDHFSNTAVGCLSVSDAAFRSFTWNQHGRRHRRVAGCLAGGKPPAAHGLPLWRPWET